MTPRPRPASQTCSIAEAAEMLGIGTSTAYELIDRRQFPVRVLQVGARKKVSRRELDRFLSIEAP
jgi:excisionase family DNA binding protein